MNVPWEAHKPYDFKHVQAYCTSQSKQIKSLIKVSTKIYGQIEKEYFES